MKGIIKTFLTALILMVCCLTNNNIDQVYANSPEGEGIDVLLIIDQSGSMDWDDRDHEKRALNMADFFVKNLPDEDLRLGVYSFATDVHEIYKFGKVSSGKQDKIWIENHIKELEYAGDTDMGDVFEKCADIWDEIKSDASKRKQMIVFMTDGEISFGKDETEEDHRKADDSRERMRKALERIDCTKFPIYVIAFGDEAVEGKDAREISEIEGNHFIAAKEKANLEEAYNNVFENILGTKAVKQNSISIAPGHNTFPLNNDDSQNGLNVNITTGEQGSGSAVSADTQIKIKNDETGEIWENDTFGDYTDEYLGRLLKIPEEILKSGPLSLVFETNEKDIINVKEYFLYDIKYFWKVEDNSSYKADVPIKLSVSVDGVDKENFVVYAIFNKLDSSGELSDKTVIPEKIDAGEQAKNIKIYGSSLEEKDLLTLSGVKTLLDTEQECFTTTVTFNEPGEYQVWLYGENQYGFAVSEPLRFTVLKQDGESENGTWNKILQKIEEIWNKIIDLFNSLPLWGKALVIGIGGLIVLRVIYVIISNRFRRFRDEDDE